MKKLTIIGGGLEDKLLSKTDVEALAKLPSLNDLRGKNCWSSSSTCFKASKVNYGTCFSSLKNYFTKIKTITIQLLGEYYGRFRKNCRRNSNQLSERQKIDEHKPIKNKTKRNNFWMYWHDRRNFSRRKKL